MGLPIRWSPRAARHLEESYAYIEQDSVRYAVLFAQRVLRTVESISENPRLERMVPEYEEENLRERIYQGRRIIYRVKEDAIEIAAICHGARRIQDAME